MKEKQNKAEKNIWQGDGRLRIEIPKTVLKQKIYTNDWLKNFHLCGLGYYPKARGHFTYRKRGHPDNFLFYCVDGHGCYKIGEKQYEIGPNEFFILPQNIEHTYRSKEDHPWTIYWLHLGGSFLPEFNNIDAVKKHFGPSHIKNTTDISSHFLKIYKALELGYSTDNLFFVNMCFFQLISQFIYHSKHHDIKSNKKTDVVDSAILYLQEHLNESITLSELSARFNYSPSRFSGLFKQKTGYSPIDYFIQMKMQMACRELDFTNKAIKEISIGLGFIDPYYFSSRFKTIIGVSPKKYRAIKKD